MRQSIRLKKYDHEMVKWLSQYMTEEKQSHYTVVYVANVPFLVFDSANDAMMFAVWARGVYEIEYLDEELNARVLEYLGDQLPGLLRSY